tara:strand:- start:145 stop:612 length:468 start_codon:yes stop_codon:yes gene_type:complete
MKNTISFNTKFGWVSATEIDNKITKILFQKEKNRGRLTKNLKNLKKFFKNFLTSKKNKINLTISMIGKNQQKRVWRELKKIKFGNTKTYGDIGKKLKISPRYVGRICGENKHIIYIPCHRVIKSDGSLGGFSAPSGVRLKRRLLEFEKNFNSSYS